MNASNPVHQPTSSEELSAIIQSAAANGQQLSLSRKSPPEGALQVSLQNMQTVVEYPARDMTITVQAGLPLSELQHILAQENQQLPIDCGDPSISIGALVAANISGSRRYGYGTLRDYLIGMEAVDGQGRIFHAGGRVVKNVAGYDLCRLLIGSQGSLAILTQLTFKLKPRPEHSAVIQFHFKDIASFETALERLNLSAATPVVLDFASQLTSDHPYSLTLGVEGSPAACAWQLAELKKECAAGGTTDLPSLLDYCQTTATSWTPTNIRIDTPPSKLPAIIQQLIEQSHTSWGHAGNGIIYIPSPTPNKALTDFAVQHATKFENTSKNTLSHRLRETFDPQQVFGCP